MKLRVICSTAGPRLDVTWHARQTRRTLWQQGRVGTSRLPRKHRPRALAPEEQRWPTAEANILAALVSSLSISPACQHSDGALAGGWSVSAPENLFLCAPEAWPLICDAMRVLSLRNTARAPPRLLRLTVVARSSRWQKYDRKARAHGQLSSVEKSNMLYAVLRY